MCLSYYIYFFDKEIRSWISAMAIYNGNNELEGAGVTTIGVLEQIRRGNVLD